VKNATGLTLSAAQAAWISHQNLGPVTVRLENWFYHKPPQPYDAIISIAAFEAFARPGLDQETKDIAYRQFFQRCHQWLKAGGRLGIQTIARGNMFREDFNHFISVDIFPESDLPSLAELARASERLFEVLTIRNDREDYVRTLKAWRHNLKLNRAAAVRIAGEGLVARYEKYLDLSMLGFHTGATDLLRIIFRRIDNPSP
jgi:cyclopropane-fatty-acyl-phospholipid synthase